MSLSKSAPLLSKLVYLITLSACAQGIQTGDRIPAFSLPDQNGKLQTFESLRGPKGAMIVFHRSADWCAFCKSQLIELEQSRTDLARQGLGLAAISYDPVAILKFFSDRKSIHFPLLSDEDSSAIRAFGILNGEVPQTSEFYGIPHPITYIVDRDGIVQSRNFETDFRRRFTVGNMIGRKTNPIPITAKRVKITQSASDTTVHGGQRLKLSLDLEIPAKSHVYAPGVQNYIPIDWKLKPNPAYEALEMKYPEARSLYLKAIEETVPVFEGRLTLEREVVTAQKVTPPLQIEGELRYQVCDDRQCFVPETVPLVWTLQFEPHDSIRAPIELRRKRTK